MTPHLSDDDLQAVAEGTLVSPHPDECRPCASEVARYQRLFGALAVPAAFEVPIDFTAQVLSRIERTTRDRTAGFAIELIAACGAIVTLLQPRPLSLLYAHVRGLMELGAEAVRTTETLLASSRGSLQMLVLMLSAAASCLVLVPLWRLIDHPLRTTGRGHA